MAVISGEAEVALGRGEPGGVQSIGASPDVIDQADSLRRAARGPQVRSIRCLRMTLHRMRLPFDSATPCSLKTPPASPASAVNPPPSADSENSVTRATRSPSTRPASVDASSDDWSWPEVNGCSRRTRRSCARTAPGSVSRARTNRRCLASTCPHRSPAETSHFA